MEKIVRQTEFYFGRSGKRKEIEEVKKERKSKKSCIFEARSSKTFRLELPNQKNLRFIESKFLDWVKQTTLYISKKNYLK